MARNLGLGRKKRWFLFGIALIFSVVHHDFSHLMSTDVVHRFSSVAMLPGVIVEPEPSGDEVLQGPDLAPRKLPPSGPGGIFRTSQEQMESWLRSTEAWGNVTTIGFWRRNFVSGYRNQVMAFSAFVMWARHFGHEQILLETIRHKDTYGTDRMMPFSFLFDVEHWNSFYPRVPRLVSCKNPRNQVNFTDFNCVTDKWKAKDMKSAKSPYANGDMAPKLFGSYLRYLKKRGPLAKRAYRNPVDLAILEGALQPHPDILQVIKTVVQETFGEESYFTLHPRIEPDMQRHKVCEKHKVQKLSRIIADMEQAFPTPPAKKLFIPVNRAMLEKEAKKKGKKKKKKGKWRPLVLKNLDLLNDMRKNGLWNGTVSVHELGSSILSTTKFAKFPSTIGALLNFHIALESEVFIGTPISSWSTDVTASRFYRGKRSENYQYLPAGIKSWTKEGKKNAPTFAC